MEVDWCLPDYLSIKCQNSVSRHWRDREGKLLYIMLHGCWSVVQAVGVGRVEEAEREPICQPHEPWQSQSQRRSNGTPTYSGKVDQFLPVRPPLIETTPPQPVLWNYRTKHVNIIELKGPQKGFRCRAPVDDSPLAVNLWWFWSFFPFPLWETWSKEKITKRDVVMTPIRWWAEAHLMFWVMVNNLKAGPELLLSTSKGHWRQCFLCFSDTNLAGMLPRAF